MRKIFFILFLFLLCICGFSISLNTNMSIFSYDRNAVKPVSKELVDIIPSHADEDYFYFEKELKKDFSLDWTERNISEESKKMLADTLSPLLSELLPCDVVLFSKYEILQDKSKSFRFKDVKKNDVYSVIYKDKKIVSITMI